MSQKSKIYYFALAAIICFVDFISSGNNGFVELILVLLSSIIVFHMGKIHFSTSRVSYLVLLIVNIVVLVLTYNHRVYLLNILLLSWLIYKVITPKILNYKWLFEVSFAIAFLMTYISALSKHSFPLFIFVFYPVYIVGCKVRDKNIVINVKSILFVTANFLISGLGLAAFIYKSLGKNIIDDILFLNIKAVGTVTAVMLPFIALFLIWFTISFNIILKMISLKFTKKVYLSDFDVLSHRSSVFYLVYYLGAVFFITYLTQFSIRLNVLQSFKDMFDPHVLFNVLLIAGIYMLLCSLLGKGISNIIVGLLTIVVVIANAIKIKYFNEPFYPWDVYLIKNLFGIAEGYVSLPVVIGGAVIVLAAFTALIIIFRKRVAKALKPRISLFIMVFSILLFGINALILNTPQLTSQLNIQKSWYIGKAEMLANGVWVQNYFYLTDLDKYINKAPVGYSYEKIKELDEKYYRESQTTQSDQQKPNVVVIMSESFWDVSKLEGVSFNKDLYENVHKLQKGELAPPAIGGSTANTEFEVLTGMSMYFINPGVIPYNVYLRTDTSSIARVFRENGYDTTAMHPNSGWFYNRDKVYKYFGFDRFYDVYSFDKSEYKGGSVSDDALVNKIISKLEDKTTEKPQFIFAITMQNHDPYIDKYESTDITVTSDVLNEEEKNTLTNLAQGLYDSDQALGKLISSIEKSGKPTLVYFFGDHASRFGSVQDYYDLFDRLVNTDKAEDYLGRLKYYKTPVATWSNYHEMRSFPNIISPTHLTYEILKDAGVKYPNYFNILPELEKKYPIMHIQNPQLVNNEDILVKDYQMIQYDVLFGKKFYNSNSKY